MASFPMYGVPDDGPSRGTSPSYSNFGGGLGGIRHGFNNPQLNGPLYTLPSLTPLSQYRKRSASPHPRVEEVFDEMDGQIRHNPNSNPNSPVSLEVDMRDGHSSIATGDCPMNDNSGSGSSRHPVADWPTKPPVHYCNRGAANPEIVFGRPSMRASTASCTPIIQSNISERIPYTPRNMRLPSISYMLSSISPPHVPATQDPYQESNTWIPPPPPPPGTPPRSSPAPGTPPSSAYSEMPDVYSDISSTTIRGPSCISERRYDLIMDLYDSCLDASHSYIQSLLRTTRSRQHRLGRRHRPYSPPAHSSVSSPRSRNSNREPTLMDNISKISTHLWREARRNVMAPHRAEADTVRMMRDLYAWGEIVVRGMENGGVWEDDDDDRSTRLELPEDSCLKVAEAAKLFCGRGLRDRNAEKVCKRILEGLSDLGREDNLTP